MQSTEEEAEVRRRLRRRRTLWGGIVGFVAGFAYGSVEILINETPPLTIEEVTGWVIFTALVGVAVCLAWNHIRPVLPAGGWFMTAALAGTVGVLLERNLILNQYQPLIAPAIAAALVLGVLIDSVIQRHPFKHRLTLGEQSRLQYQKLKDEHTAAHPHPPHTSGPKSDQPPLDDGAKPDPANRSDNPK